MYKIAILLISLLLPAWGFGQSLGDVARKERERREKNKNEGVATREFSEGEIFSDDEVDDEAIDEGSIENNGAEGEHGNGSSPMPERIDVEVAPDETQVTEDADESRERRKKEAEFRARYQEAKERVAAAAEQKRVLDGIHFVEGMKYVDENGNVVIESLDHLRRLVKEANEFLASAERAVGALEEEARRGGYPRGWLR